MVIILYDLFSNDYFFWRSAYKFVVVLSNISPTKGQAV